MTWSLSDRVFIVWRRVSIRSYSRRCGRVDRVSLSRIQRILPLPPLHKTRLPLEHTKIGFFLLVCCSRVSIRDMSLFSVDVELFFFSFFLLVYLLYSHSISFASHWETIKRVYERARDIVRWPLLLLAELCTYISPQCIISPTIDRSLSLSVVHEFQLQRSVVNMCIAFRLSFSLIHSFIHLGP